MTTVSVASACCGSSTRRPTAPFGTSAGHDVPDPYYGEDDGFCAMYDLIEPACRGLLEHLQTLVVRQ